MSRISISLTVNGETKEVQTEPREHLADLLRGTLLLTGTHIGCEHGVCGACTILHDGVPARACLLFAVQTHGHSIETVESLGTPEHLHPLQEAFRACHGLQCGYCTPGILMTMKAFLEQHPDPDEAAIRKALSGNLCRCTGYQNIVAAVARAAAVAREGA